LESDERRTANAIRIGRTYLSIEAEEIKAMEQESEKTESNNISQNNSQLHLEKADGLSEQNESSPVTDILNDELIADCKLKIHSKRRTRVY
jgi:hypothetical protein